MMQPLEEKLARLDYIVRMPVIANHMRYRRSLLHDMITPIDCIHEHEHEHGMHSMHHNHI